MSTYVSNLEAIKLFFPFLSHIRLSSYKDDKDEDGCTVCISAQVQLLTLHRSNHGRPFRNSFGSIHLSSLLKCITIAIWQERPLPMARHSSTPESSELGGVKCLTKVTAPMTLSTFSSLQKLVMANLVWLVVGCSNNFGYRQLRYQNLCAKWFW